MNSWKNIQKICFQKAPYQSLPGLHFPCSCQAQLNFYSGFCSFSYSILTVLQGTPSSEWINQVQVLQSFPTTQWWNDDENRALSFLLLFGKVLWLFQLLWCKHGGSWHISGLLHFSHYHLSLLSWGSFFPHLDWCKFRDISILQQCNYVKIGISRA